MNRRIVAWLARGGILLFSLYIGVLRFHTLLQACIARQGVPSFVIPLTGAEILGCVLFAWPRTLWFGALLLSAVFVVAISYHSEYGVFPLHLVVFLLLTMMLSILAHRLDSQARRS